MSGRGTWPTPVEIHQQYFPDEPQIVLQGHIVPRELYRPVQLLIAEIENQRQQIAGLQSQLRANGVKTA